MPEENKTVELKEDDLQKINGGNMVPVYKKCDHCGEYAWFVTGNPVCPLCHQEN